MTRRAAASRVGRAAARGKWLASVLLATLISLAAGAGPALARAEATQVSPQAPGVITISTNAPEPARAEASAYESQVVRGSDERIYVVEAGRRRWITSMEVFARRGYRWDDVQALPDAALAAIPEGRPLRVGQLVQASGPDIFLLEGGRQRWIPSLEIFEGLGFSWQDIQPIRDVDLAGYPPGPPLYAEPLIGEPELEAAVRVLAEHPQLAHIAAVLREQQVPVRFGPLPDGAVAAYHLRRNDITVQSRYRSADPKALAATLAHEAMHAAQYWRRPEPTIGGTKCYAWELEAFQVEVVAWTTLHGPAGKPSPQGDLERSLNHLAQWIREDEGSFRRALRAAYQQECG